MSFRIATNKYMVQKLTTKIYNPWDPHLTINPILAIMISGSSSRCDPWFLYSYMFLWQLNHVYKYNESVCSMTISWSKTKFLTFLVSIKIQGMPNKSQIYSSIKSTLLKGSRSIFYHFLSPLVISLFIKTYLYT